MPTPFPRAAIYKTGKGTLGPLIFLIVVMAGVLRLWSAGGDLWVDEIWSLDQMRVALYSDNPRDVVALFFHANTHALNTFYMAMVHGIFGEGASDYAYRVLSVITGIATVMVAARIGARWSVAGSIIAATMMCVSYPLIHYSGEARGYSLMMFAALSSYHLMHRYLDNPSAVKILGFVCVSLIGLMSHLTFVVMQAGLGLWALVAIYSNRHSLISTLAQLVPLFGVQLIALAAFGAIALDSMVRGGDCCPERALDSIRIMSGLSLGYDAIRFTSIIPLIVMSVLTLPTLLWLSFKRDQSWLLYAIVVVVFPLAVWLLETTPDVIHRYFLLSALFMLVVIARILETFWSRQGGYKILSIVLLVLFIVGNTDLLLKFRDGGRGQYRAALTHILQRNDDLQRITVWPGFSVSTVLNHHIRQMDVTDRLQINRKAGEGSIPGDWYIDGYLYGKPAPQEIIREIAGFGEARYTLKKTFKQWGLSGDTYALYKLER